MDKRGERILLIKPGNQVKIIDKKNKASGMASVLRVSEREISLVLLSALRLNPGDMVELEAPRWEDALYVFPASVLEIGENQECTLLKLGEAKRLQRRSSERLPADHSAEFILISEKKPERIFREAYILNISKTGALLTVEEPLDPKSELLLMFELILHTITKDRVVPTAVKGKVVREYSIPPEGSRWRRYSYGVEFEKPFTALA